MSSQVFRENLLPGVKEVDVHDEILNLEECNLQLDEVEDPSVRENIERLLIQKLKKNNVKVGSGGAKLFLSREQEELTPVSEQGYVLEISGEGIKVRANADAGLYYGVLSFLQILEQKRTGKIEYMSIRDWPSLNMRMYHCDLKTIPLDFEYLKHLIDVLSQHKVNYVLMEYEDKFPYEKYSDIVAPSAMTMQQIEELQEFCRARCVSIVPLVQSYGHLEYILQKDEYEHLREDPEKLNEICGTNPEAKKMVREMMEEVIAAHPNLQFFHIGGDEPFRARFCPNCKEIIEEKGKGALYLQHIKPIIEFIQDKDLVPVIWDDMLATFPEISDKLPNPLMINYWYYAPTELTDDTILVRGYGKIDSKEVHSKVDEKTIDRFEKYWECDEYPEKAKSFPLVAYYKDLGYKVIGAGAARVSKRNPLYISEHAENLRCFSNELDANGQDGILATAWAAANSLAPPGEYWEYYWYSNLSLAEQGWTGGRTEPEVYAKKFARQYYGLDSEGLTQFLSDPVEKKKEKLDEVLNHTELDAEKNVESFNLYKCFLKRKLVEEKLEDITEEGLRETSKFSPDLVKTIDLRDFANRGFTDKDGAIGWTNDGDNDMREFPVGKQIFGGVPFDIIDPDQNENKTVVCLKNNRSDPNLPEEVGEIPVNERCRYMYFLHTTAETSHKGLHAGEYIIRFKDGETRRIPLVTGENIQDWWGGTIRPEESDVVWKGMNKITRQRNNVLGTYLFRWVNPDPERNIASLSIRTEGKCSLITLGISLIKPGQNLENSLPRWQEVKEKLKNLEENLDVGHNEEKKLFRSLVKKELVDYFSRRRSCRRMLLKHSISRFISV